VTQLHGCRFQFAVRIAGCLLALAALVSSTQADSRLDQLLNAENAAKNLLTAPLIDDLTFLRRLSIDMIGRIPTIEEIQEYEAWPAAERRSRLTEKLVQHPGFSDRWTVFMADLLRIRSNADGGSAELAFVHKAVEDNMPYDVLVRQLMTATGKAGKIPEVGFVLGDNADPMALAGTAAQVFMGTRIACAQCHDHPFDVWSQEDFYGMAAYFGRTQRRESEFTNSVYVQEMVGNRVKWPPEGKGPEADRKPMAPKFPVDLKLDKQAPEFETRLVSLRKAEEEARRAAEAAKRSTVDDLLAVASNKVASGKFKPEQFDVAGDAKQAARNLNVEGDLRTQSELRRELADLITHPRNRLFSKTLVNRVWADLMGRGFVEPVDDFSVNNPPSHPQTLDYLADEFVANGYNLRKLVSSIVTSDAYARGHLYEGDEIRKKQSEEMFAATPVRRMLAEAMFDSIVSAGHLFTPKHAQGENLKTYKEIIQVAVDLEGKPTQPSKSVVAQLQGNGGAAMGGMKGPGNAMAAAGGGGLYDLESAIEVDFKQVLAMAAKDDEPKVEMMKVSTEEMEAQQMMAANQGRRRKYVDQVVERTVDDNPVFASAMRMPSPAPPAHFLRIFGQPARDQLGDFRDHSASMRQALMMLNGKMTNEAARVGKLEPMYKLVSGKTADPDEAVRLAYREILTREPSADELAEARSMMSEAASPLDGIADLRWILFNCHEFRFVP
jgi:hypothetical protein